MRHVREGRAYCKINLLLKIKGVMADGYHDLFMLMNGTGLGDDICVTADEGGSGKITVPAVPGLPSEKNLCYKAADAYLKAAGLDYDVDIKLTKNVPSGAGLGGGSSDAAFVLNALNSFSKGKLDSKQMTDIAVKIGADVPFFLEGGTAICEGKGEIITKMPSLAGVSVLLIKPREGVNTGECYRLSDSTCDFSRDLTGYYSQIKEIFGRADLSPAERISLASPMLLNDLQEPAQMLLPKIGDIYGKVKESGCIFAMMSGSGSTVYGIYKDEEAAGKAEAELQKDPVISDCQIYSTVLL